MGGKKNKKRALAFLAIAGIILAFGLVWKAMRTDIVIYLGVRVWNTVNTARAIGYKAALILYFIFITRSAYLREDATRKRKKEGEETEKAKEGAAEKSDPGALSMKGKLDTETVASLLGEAAEKGSWGAISEETQKCRKQLGKMDEYQERLHGLLEENDAQKLSDVEEAVCRVEQYMLQNVRKVCNYMQVYDSSDSSDLERTKKQAQACIQDNQEQLAQVKGLLAAVADFLNSQGQDATALEALEIYKNTILRTVQEGKEGERTI